MPALSYTEIQKKIQEQKSGHVFLLHGSESYFIDKLVDMFDSWIIPDLKDFDQDIIYGKEAKVLNIIEALSRYPVGEKGVLVIVKGMQDLKSSEELLSYIHQPIESSTLVLVHPTKAIDGRTKLATALKKNHFTFESKSLWDNELPKWIIDQMAAIGKKINPDNAAMMADYLGNDLKKIENEITKMSIALSDKKEVDREDIHKYVGISREFNVFALNGALAVKDRAKAMLIADYIADNLNKQPLVLIIGSIFTFFTKVIMLKEKNAKTDAEITAIINSRSLSAIKEYKSAMMQYNMAELDQIMFLLKTYDQFSKGVNSDKMADHAILKEMTLKILYSKEVTINRLKDYIL